MLYLIWIMMFICTTRTLVAIRKAIKDKDEKERIGGFSDMFVYIVLIYLLYIFSKTF